jgi:glycosyltransferase involved in cell wall biosynthesis
MEKHLVSIIIPTYKRPLKLARAIDSVLNQTYSNLEVIVVDDNNPNTVERKETEELMKRYEGNSKVKYIKHDYNKNGSAARNTGFRNSNGEYIMFLDDDDEFLPRKVEAQVKCLESRDKSWGACYTKYKRLKNGKVDTICAENREGNLYFEELCRNLFIQAGSNLMVRRNAFEEIGGFDETFQRNQDIEFTVRLLKKYKLAYVDEMGLIYHRHLPSEKRFFNMDQITEHYLNAFKTHIEELSEEERAKFYKLINLQLFRYRVITRRNILSGCRMVRNGEVRVIDVIRYFSHLAYRRIFKKSIGFKI